MNGGAPTPVRWNGLAHASMTSSEVTIAKRKLFWTHSRKISVAEILAHEPAAGALRRARRFGTKVGRTGCVVDRGKTGTPMVVCQIVSTRREIFRAYSSHCDRSRLVDLAVTGRHAIVIWHRCAVRTNLARTVVGNAIVNWWQLCHYFVCVSIGNRCDRAARLGPLTARARCSPINQFNRRDVVSPALPNVWVCKQAHL